MPESIYQIFTDSGRPELEAECFMKRTIVSAVFTVILLGCSRNEPGTMGGGNPGVPKTVATGAPAEAIKETPASDPKSSSKDLERSASTFGETNGPGAPKSK